MFWGPESNPYRIASDDCHQGTIVNQKEKHRWTSRSNFDWQGPGGTDRAKCVNHDCLSLCNFVLGDISTTITVRDYTDCEEDA